MNNKLKNAERESSSTTATCYTAGNINLYLMDNMDLMKQYEDNYFDLAIVDVPYGINQGGDKNASRCKLATSKAYRPFIDEKAPSKSYFDELFRVSKNQIIWGANHFISKLPIDSSCWIVWDKQNGKTDFADSELAWTSFKTAVRNFTYRWQGMLQGNMKNKEVRIHPTQKPIKLYEWILDRYAKQGDKILDTHLGSGSIAIACDKMGFELTACEIDEEYFNGAVKRLKEHQDQYKLNFEAV